PNYRLMDWSQILALHAGGFSFGVHSATHPNLSRVTPQNLSREIDEAAHELSIRLRVPLSELCFSYPDGDYNETLKRRIASSGLYGAVTVREALVTGGDDPYALPRVGISRHHSPASFLDVTVGFTRFLKRAISF